MKVAVTGAAGLLGRYVVKRLLARGDSVVAVDALNRYQMLGVATPQEWPAELKHERCLRVLDRFDSSDVFAMIREEAPDAIVHAAANTSHPRSIEDPAMDFEVNLASTFRLLEFLRTWDTGEALIRSMSAIGARPPSARPRLVNIGSAKVYNMAFREDFVETPTRLERPVDGLRIDENWPIGGFVTPFGVSKLAAEQYVLNYSRLYGLDAVTLRPGCFTGAGSLATTAQNWAPMLVRAMVRQEPFTVFGFGGKQVRDLLHADDLARLAIACVDWPPAGPIEVSALDTIRPGDPSSFVGDAFNACGGPERSVSILEAVALIERLTRKRGELIFAPERAADWKWFIGSSEKAKAALGWEPEIGLESIFRELCLEAGAEVVA